MEDVLERLVDAATRSESEQGADAAQLDTTARHPRQGLLRQVNDLFDRVILPRVSSGRIFRARARLLTSQGRWEEALNAYMEAYRCSTAGMMEKGETDVSKWREAVGEVEEMVDLGIRTFGSYVGACAVLYARLWLTSFARLDRHQPDCDADDCAPLVHAARRLLPSHPSRYLCLFVAYRVKRLERARRQAATS